MFRIGDNMSMSMSMSMNMNMNMNMSMNISWDVRPCVPCLRGGGSPSASHLTENVPTVGSDHIGPDPQ
jgi:hypothetical protein